MLLWGGLVALLIGLAMLVNAAVKWWAQFYFVTNQKVMKVEGILRKSTSGSALEKINDITMEQPLLGRWLGYGTVRVLTAADESNLHYTFMRKPLEFRKAILDAKLLFEKQDSRDIAEAFREGVRPGRRRARRPGAAPARRSPTRSSAWPSCATAGRSRPRSSRPRRPSSSTACSRARHAAGPYGDRRRRVQAARVVEAAGGMPAVLDPVVQPGEAAHPELHHLGHQHVPAPVVGHRDRRRRRRSAPSAPRPARRAPRG